MNKQEMATLGGGCYWCLEALYQRLKGVSSVVSGFSGGHVDNPSYEAVCQGNTGHAEVIQVTFDPRVISYKELLEIFFTMHDPTTLNSQGADVGEQYRSIILYHSDAQKKVAEEMIKGFAAKLWSGKIVTQVVKFEKFWPGPKEHQDFYNKNEGVGYCQIVINPKVSKLRQKFALKLKSNDLN